MCLYGWGPLSVFLPLCSSCTVWDCYRPSKWNICVNEQHYIYLQISWQHVNNQIDVMSFRETSSCSFSFCLALSVLFFHDLMLSVASWILYIYALKWHIFIQRGNTRPLALNSRLSDYVKRVMFDPKGHTLFVKDVQHFPAAVMNCSSQLDQRHSVKAP